MKKIFIATVINFTIVMILGYFIYGKLFDGNNFNLSPTELIKIIHLNYLIYILISEFVFSFFLAMIYKNWIVTFLNGAKIGFAIGSIVGLSVMIILSIPCITINIYHFIFYSLSFAIRYSVSGGTIGLYYSKKYS